MMHIVCPWPVDHGRKKRNRWVKGGKKGQIMVRTLIQLRLFVCSTPDENDLSYCPSSSCDVCIWTREQQWGKAILTTWDTTKRLGQHVLMQCPVGWSSAWFDLARSSSYNAHSLLFCFYEVESKCVIQQFIIKIQDECSSGTVPVECSCSWTCDSSVSVQCQIWKLFVSF